MLRLVFRKIINNKWMVACLIIGCTFAIAVASSIPMYTVGLYNSLLVTAFKTQQENNDEFPFRIMLNASLYGEDTVTANTILNKFVLMEVGNVTSCFTSLMDNEAQEFGKSMSNFIFTH